VKQKKTIQVGAGKILTKQGRIDHRSGLNNENNKNLDKKISYLTVQMVKADIF